MINQQVQARRPEQGEVVPNSHAPPRRKHGSIENGKAVWSLWATVHWIVFSTITLSVIYLVVLLQ